MTRAQTVLRLGVAALFLVTMVSGQAAAGLTVADTSVTTADGGQSTFDVTTDSDHDDDCETRLTDTDGDGDPEVVIDCNG